jgi:hypothetical protein
LVWLSKIWQNVINDQARESLAKWYGEEVAKNITQAETFEICEYGRRPSDDEIRKLFPMLGE